MAGIEAFAAVAAELAARNGNGGSDHGAESADALEALLPDDPLG
jgi:hypothetical protein